MNEDQCSKCRQPSVVKYLGTLYCQRCMEAVFKKQEQEWEARQPKPADPGQPWALVDLSWLVHRARYAMGQLTHDDAHTGIILGVFEQLRTVCADPRVNTNLVALCCDSRQSYRRLDFPEYKSGRGNKTPEEWAEFEIMDQQRERLRTEIFPDIGFKVFHQTGLESDDLMAQASIQLKSHKGVMITADGDLYQSITETVHWFDPMRDLYLDLNGLLEKERCTPEAWVDVKCMAGCDGDGVPGIPGVGKKSAVDYLWKLLPPTHKRYQAITSDEGVEIANRNWKLVALPRKETKPVDLAPPTYDMKKFDKWAEKLGFKSYLDGPRRTQWERFFKGDPTGIRGATRMRGQ